MQKYSSTGNTFAIFDNTRNQHHVSDRQHWKNLAHQTGVDGVIFLESPSSPAADFQMRYLNADGNEVEMCGNGARALGLFIQRKNPSASPPFRLQTGHGVCEIVATRPLPCLRMPGGESMGSLDISDLFPANHSFFLICGVPHAIFFVTDVQDVDIPRVAPPLSRHPRFPRGANINFVQILQPGRISSRVYERGVERETLSCGTGAAAASVACAKLFSWSGQVDILTPGGELTVRPSSDKDGSLLLAGQVTPLEEQAP